MHFAIKHRRSSTILAAAAGLAALTLPFRADARTTHGPSGHNPLNPVFERIEDAFSRGEIDYGKRLYYRMAAVRAPELLPPDWQKALPVRSDGAACHTPVFVEAIHALPTLEVERQVEIGKLLEPPPDLAYWLDATSPYPVRVSYRQPEQETLAQAILDAVAFAYTKLVDETGYWIPPIEPGAEYYRIRINATPGASGWTVPYDPVLSTDHADYYTFIEISEDFQEHSEWVRGTVVHEFAHACQAAMDALEPVAFWENSATYATAMTEGYSIYYIMGSAASFQSRPWRPLEYKMQNGSDGYEYGGCFWIFFMEHLYANDDPVWLREVWEGCVQTGIINEPDYFDVLDAKLQDFGGFTEMVKTFAQYRYFAGRDDDGYHLPDTYRFREAEVPKLHEWKTSDLPIRDATPMEDVRPMPNGCNYIDLEVDTCDGYPVRFSFQGQADLLWHVELMHVTGDATTTYARMTVDASSGAGRVEMEGEVGDKLVMAVCQLGGEGYEPDWPQEWIGGNYAYSIDRVAPAPTVTAVEPNLFVRGTQDATMYVYGSGFANYPGLSVSFGDPNIVAEIDRFVSSEQLEIRLIVRQGAGLGPRDVTVTNPGGAQGVGVDLVTIVDELPRPPEPRTYKGCMCAFGSSGPDTTGLLLLVAIALVGLLRTRRR